MDMDTSEDVQMKQDPSVSQGATDADPLAADLADPLGAEVNEEVEGSDAVQMGRGYLR